MVAGPTGRGQHLSPTSLSMTRMLLLGALAVVPAFAAPAVAQSDAFLLARGRAGPIRTGMFVDTVYRHVDRKAVSLIDLFGEGMFTPAIAVRLPGSVATPALIAPIREWPCFAFAVQGIDVRDPRFRTKEGIGVGSTVGDVRRAYRDARFSEEEGPHLWVESQRMNFRMASAANVDTTRVTAVWLPGDDPRVVRQQVCPERGPIR